MIACAARWGSECHPAYAIEGPHSTIRPGVRQADDKYLQIIVFGQHDEPIANGAKELPIMLSIDPGEIVPSILAEMPKAPNPSVKSLIRV